MNEAYQYSAESLRDIQLNTNMLHSYPIAL